MLLHVRYINIYVLYTKKLIILIFFKYFLFFNSSTDRQVVGRNCRVQFYEHIPTGVRDGRDATLLLQVHLIIALLMVRHNDHENGGRTPPPNDTSPSRYPLSYRSGLKKNISIHSSCYCLF